MHEPDNNLRHFIQHWLLDPLCGLPSFFTHYSLRVLPLNMNTHLGVQWGSVLFHIIQRKQVRQARHNLRKIRPDLNKKELETYLLRLWHNMGITICEYSILDKLWSNNRIEIFGREHLESIPDGTPIIYPTIHLANWEAPLSFMAEDRNFLALYLPIANRFYVTLLKIARKRMGIKLISTKAKNPMKTMLNHLQKKNTALFIALDAQKKGGNIQYPLFGRRVPNKGSNANFTIRLAKRTNAAILPYYVERKSLKKPKLVLHIYPALYTTENTEEELLLTLNTLTEEWVKKHPDQWFMLGSLNL